MTEKTFTVVGKPVIRQDGPEKVTGQAKFADDYVFPRQLSAVMIRIPVAHAVIRSIDYSAIEKDPAIVAICDARDIPASNKIGVVRRDQPIFSAEKIVTPGDVIAMLVGESEDKLRDLSGKVKVTYDLLPALTDSQKALDEDAPLIHPELKSNLIVHYPLRKGQVEKGFSESDHILEQTYSTQRIEHAYIEPECVSAIPLEGNKGIQIIGSIQNPFTTRRIVSEVLGWPLAKVRIQQADLGGSFGGKDDTMCILAARAAVAALKTGRPVKIRYSREDSIIESYKRHPYLMHYKVGFMKDGKIKAMKIDILADGGAYASMSPFVTWRTVVQATGPYEIEHVWTDVRAVYTNNPYTGAMRGFGSPQPIFAQESIMDEIAIQLQMTPVDIRKINGLQAGSITASGQVMEKHDVNLLTVLDTATSASDFAKQWTENSARIKPLVTVPGTILRNDDFLEPSDLLQKGIGLALSFRGCSLGAEGIDAAAAYLSLQLDGSVYLLSGLAENGQGLRTTYCIIAAELLGINPESVYYLTLNTDSVPDSGPTVASRSTIMGGSAVKNAAEIVRARLEDLLRTEWNLSASDELVFAGSRVTLKTDPGKSIGFGELCGLAYRKGINLSTIGWYSGPHVHWDESVGQGPAYFTYVYGCQVAEVTVNLATGEIFVDRVTAVHDPGTVINVQGADGQVFGGVTQGAGYAILEELNFHGGFINEINFDEYLIPTSLDVGEIRPIFVQGNDEYGPWGAKCLGEPTLELTAAAIGNAIRNAIGKRYFNLPLNLEEIILQRKLRPEDVVKGA